MNSLRLVTNWLRTATTLFILSFLIFYVGCTVVGYVVGDGIDESHARSRAASLNPDSCRCEKGDHIKLVLVSGDSLEGRVKEIMPGEYIRVMTRFPDPISRDQGKIEDINWEDLRSLFVLKRPFTWRPILLSAGLVIDVGIWAIVTAYTVGMSAISGLQ
jgi:hypothetical protein